MGWQYSSHVRYLFHSVGKKYHGILCPYYKNQVSISTYKQLDFHLSIEYINLWLVSAFYVSSFYYVNVINNTLFLTMIVSEFEN